MFQNEVEGRVNLGWNNRHVSQRNSDKFKFNLRQITRFIIVAAIGKICPVPSWFCGAVLRVRKKRYADPQKQSQCFAIAMFSLDKSISCAITHFLFALHTFSYNPGLLYIILLFHYVKIFSQNHFSRIPSRDVPAISLFMNCSFKHLVILGNRR